MPPFFAFAHRDVLVTISVQISVPFIISVFFFVSVCVKLCEHHTVLFTNYSCPEWMHLSGSQSEISTEKLHVVWMHHCKRSVQGYVNRTGVVSSLQLLSPKGTKIQPGMWKLALNSSKKVPCESLKFKPVGLQDGRDSVDIIWTEPMAVRPMGHCETDISSRGAETSTYTLFEGDNWRVSNLAKKLMFICRWTLFRGGLSNFAW